MPVNISDYSTIDTDCTGVYEEPVAITRGWRQRALCSEETYDQFSWCGERAKSRPIEKAICWEECPVRKECLTEAIVQMEKHCIYGGYNFGQRRLIWRRWKDAGTLPEMERTYVDAEEMWRLVTESSTSRFPDMAQPVYEYEYDEPDERQLRAIELELEDEST